jgi:hypothetical protein
MVSAGEVKRRNTRDDKRGQEMRIVTGVTGARFRVIRVHQECACGRYFIPMPASDRRTDP